VPTDHVERRLASILAADVAGYSRLMGADEEGTFARLMTHRRELIDPKIREHHGRIVKTTGDGMLVEFASPVEAVRCAAEVQQGMVERNAGLSDDKHITFRVGVNLGDVIVERKDIYGDGVNVAARLQELADPGAVLISGAVYEHIRDKLALDFDDLGERSFKNIVRPVHVHRVGAGRSPPRPALALPEKPSIAVLPFTNMSGDPEQEYFADGITEDIITALSRVRWFFVIARTSTFTYKHRTVDVKQVARELGVRYVLEGSIRKTGTRVRITGQLIEAASGHHLWADRFDGDFVNIFDLQDRVTSSVVAAIEPNLRRAEIERAKSKPTDKLDAYDLYLRALPQHYAITQPASDAALALLHRAIEIDPEYSVAKALAAYCHMVRVWQTWTRNPEESAEGLRLAREALLADRDDPTTLRMAGHALTFFGRDYEGGIAALDRALMLNVNSAQAFSSSGWIRDYMGDPDVAIDHFTRAIRLSPLDPEMGYFMSGLGLAHLIRGDDEAALAWGRKAVLELPKWVTGHRIVAVSLVHLGRVGEAQAVMQSLREIAPTFSIEHMKKHSPYRDPEFFAKYLDGLRKAGSPEE
jgi:adenylate cyclase